MRTRGGVTHWIWMIGFCVFSFFLGLGIGKLLRRGLLALAIPELARALIHLALIWPIAYVWGQIAGWIDGKIFPSPVWWQPSVFSSRTQRPSVQKQAA